MSPVEFRMTFDGMSDETDPAPAVRLSGRGDWVSDRFDLAGGVVTLTMRHDGSRHFSVVVQDEEGNHKGLAANVVGRYKGGRLLALDQGAYVLGVTASGPWQIVVEQCRARVGHAIPFSRRGTGDAALGPLQLSAGHIRVDLTHQGQKHFAVALYDGTRGRIGLLANAVGSYSGSHVQRISGEGIYYLDIQADQLWTVDVTPGVA